MASVTDRTLRRTAKVRRNVRRAGGHRARLSVFRSSKHIYAQVIDDANGRTVVSASSLEKDMRGSFKTGQHRGGKGGGKTARRARLGEGYQGGRLRSRRLSFSRPRQGAGGRGPRGRAQFLKADEERKR